MYILGGGSQILKQLEDTNYRKQRQSNTVIIVIPKVENPIHGKVNVFKDIIQEMKKIQFVLKKYTVFQK